MTFVSGKDRPQRSAAKAMQQAQHPKNNDSDQLMTSHNYESLIQESFAPKAFSPEPIMTDRINLLSSQE